MISRNGLAYLWAGTPPMREWRAKREEAEKRATERPSSKSIRDAEGASSPRCAGSLGLPIGRHCQRQRLLSPATADHGLGHGDSTSCLLP
jgi:hypothetical protein